MSTCTEAERVKDVSFISDFVSKYQKGFEIEFNMNGEVRHFEYSAKFSSVAILLYHREFDKFLMVRQFRPAVFAGKVTRLAENFGRELNDIDWSKYDAKMGYTLELCAGLIDKDLPVIDIAREEVAEECGYAVTNFQLETLATFLVGTNLTGNTQYVFYAEIDETMKISEGGGNVAEGEVISKRFHVLPNLNLWRPLNVFPMEEIRFKSDFDAQKYGYSPRRMFFTIGSLTRNWDLALAKSTIVVLVYDASSNELVFLQYFRPASFIGRVRILKENKGVPLNQVDWKRHDHSWAYTLELCGSTVEPMEDLPTKAAEVVASSLGYEVDQQSFRHIAHFVTGIGQSGDCQDVYFAQVNEETERCSRLYDKDTLQVRFTLELLPTLLAQPCLGPPTTYFAIQWFLDYISS